MGNVPYVPDGHIDQKLDIYLPTSGDGPFPALFMIHQGGGRKEQLAFWGRSFAERGYAAISINHRQWPDHRYPADVEDAFCALAWVHAARGRQTCSSAHRLTGSVSLTLIVS